ncbi:MAG: hypothetical protein ACKPKO_51270, partial [Candidatus Fonsibacter sp.]
NLLAQKQPTITSSTNLAVNNLTTISWELSAGFTDVHTKADQVYFGNPVWLTATSLSAKIWSPVYVEQGISIQVGI